MTNNMASSGLWENVIFTKMVLTIDSTIGCVMSSTWCQNVWHQSDDAGPHTYPMLRCVYTECRPLCFPCPSSKWYVLGTFHPDNVEGFSWFGSSGLLNKTYVLIHHIRVEHYLLNQTSSYMWDNWNFPMFLLSDWSLTLIYIASLMVLVRVFYSLPMTEKLSNLVWWPEVLTWSQMGEGVLKYFF